MWDYAALDDGEESILQTCSGCNMPPEPDDDTMHIVSYGCDHCTRWWHCHCLEGPAQTTADLSVIDNSTKWRCPACQEEPICGVCLLSVSNLTAAQCYICMAEYHVSCLPSHQIDYSVLVDLGQKWYCGQCNEQYFFSLQIFKLKILPCSTARVILGQAFSFYLDLVLNFQLLLINIFKCIY